MKPSRLMTRSLSAFLLLPLLGCGAIRNPDGMYRNVGQGTPPPPPPEPGASVSSGEILTPREILEGKTPELHSQGLPGFAREAVPDRVMLQDQLNSGYIDSPTPMN